MSSIVNKVKEALHSDKDRTDTHHSAHNTNTNTTHHPSATEPRVHNTATTGTGVGGSHNSAFTGNDNYTVGGTGLDNRGIDGPATKTDGPHSSNIANKADPRVDSDRDHSKNLGMNPQGNATTGSGAGAGAHTTHSSTGTHSNSATGPGVIGGGALAGDHHGRTGHATRNDGPHDSNLANKADPRVDSDRDHSRNLGANPHGTATTGVHGSHTAETSSFGNTGIPSAHGANTGVHGSTTETSSFGNTGIPSAHGANPHGTVTIGYNGSTAGTPGFGNTGIPSTTHGSSHVGGTNAGHTDAAGTHGTHGTHNTHGSTGTGLAGSHGTHTGTTGTTGTHGTHDTLASHTGSGPGPAPKTAGPHKSDMLNKMDPRVDSNLDGSKTVGGNKTTLEDRDPTDATQVPPSVMQKHIGKPSIEHDDHAHDRERRHSVSHQEQHRGH
ncbi:hypothetical protein EsDP_00006132 [Epichloe bromicola]|uniref:Period circadian protein n=1 Tax=Epichloe bromicola TaxID=79588 RepID=A0ABQ0CWP5_9HYPO